MLGHERTGTNSRLLSSGLDGVPLCRRPGPAPPTDHACQPKSWSTCRVWRKKVGCLQARLRYCRQVGDNACSFPPAPRSPLLCPVLTGTYGKGVLGNVVQPNHAVTLGSQNSRL